MLFKKFSVEGSLRREESSANESSPPTGTTYNTSGRQTAPVLVPVQYLGYCTWPITWCTRYGYPYRVPGATNDATPVPVRVLQMDTRISARKSGKFFPTDEGGRESVSFHLRNHNGYVSFSHGGIDRTTELCHNLPTYHVSEHRTIPPMQVLNKLIRNGAAKRHKS